MRLGKFPKEDQAVAGKVPKKGPLAAGVLVMSVVLTPATVANVVGTDTQNFNPAISHPEYVTVQGSQTLDQGRFNFGLFLNQATNSLPYKTDDAQSRTEANDSLVGMDLGIGMGVLKNLDLGVTLPFVAHQSIDDQDPHGEFEERGNTEVRAGLKWRVLDGMGSTRFGLAVIASANVNRIKENPHTGGGAGPTYNLELAADTGMGKWGFAANLGYRLREPGEPVEGALVEPLGNQIIASAAASYQVAKKSRVISEVYGSQASDFKTDSNRAETSSELLLGYRYDYTKQTLLHAGAGTELTQGMATPDWRLYLGLNQLLETGGRQDRPVVRKKKRRRRKVREAPVEPYVPSPEDNIYFAAAAGEDHPALYNPIDQIPDEEPDEVIVLKDVKFEFDSDFRILQGGLAELQKIAEYARDTGFHTIVVEGHTDYYGTHEYNDDLSLRRAQTVRRHFVKYLDFGGDDVIAVGFGERRPKTDDTSDYGRQINRRVEVKIYRD